MLRQSCAHEHETVPCHRPSHCGSYLPLIAAVLPLDACVHASDNRIIGEAGLSFLWQGEPESHMRTLPLDTLFWQRHPAALDLFLGDWRLNLLFALKLLVVVGVVLRCSRSLTDTVVATTLAEGLGFGLPPPAAPLMPVLHFTSPSSPALRLWGSETVRRGGAAVATYVAFVGGSMVFLASGRWDSLAISSAGLAFTCLLDTSTFQLVLGAFYLAPMLGAALAPAVYADAPAAAAALRALVQLNLCTTYVCSGLAKLGSWFGAWHLPMVLANSNEPFSAVARSVLLRRGSWPKTYAPTDAAALIGAALGAAEATMGVGLLCGGRASALTRLVAIGFHSSIIAAQARPPRKCPRVARLLRQRQALH